jgi:hypothetical protein
MISMAKIGLFERKSNYFRKNGCFGQSRERKNPGNIASGVISRSELL